MRQRFGNLTRNERYRRRLLADAEEEYVYSPNLIVNASGVNEITNPNGVENQAESALTAWPDVDLVDGDETEYCVAGDDFNGVAATLVTCQSNPLPTYEDIDAFTSTVEDGVKSSMKLRLKYQCTGVQAGSALRLNIGIYYYAGEAGDALIAGQVGDNTAANYIVQTFVTHANQSGIQEAIIDVNTTEFFDTFTDWSQTSGRLSLNLLWHNPDGASNEDGTNIRLYSIDLEVID